MSLTRFTGWEALRSRRDQLGLSLEDVSIATRISVAYLAAIEEGRFEELPEGPYRLAYLRAYREVLELEPEPPGGGQIGEEEAAAEELPVGIAPARRWKAWAAGAGGALAVIGLAALAAWQLLNAEPGVEGEPEPEPTAVVAPEGVDAAELDQEVVVRANQDLALLVRVDGELVYDGKLAYKESLTFRGRDRVEVELPAVEAARVRYNGATIVPQGRQDVPRRLVFIDDGGR